MTNIAVDILEKGKDVFIYTKRGTSKLCAIEYACVLEASKRTEIPVIWISNSKGEISTVCEEEEEKKNCFIGHPKTSGYHVLNPQDEEEDRVFVYVIQDDDIPSLAHFLDICANYAGDNRPNVYIDRCDYLYSATRDFMIRNRLLFKDITMVKIKA